MKKNLIRKLLAWLLVLTMSFLMVGAVADDVNVYNENKTVEGDVDGNVYVRSSGEPASLTVTGDVEGDASVNSFGGNATLEVGDDVEGHVSVSTDYPTSNATVEVGGDVNGGIYVFSDEPSSANVTVDGAVSTQDGTAVDASANRGSITVETGDVTGVVNDDESVDTAVSANAYSRQENVSGSVDMTVGDVTGERGLQVNVSANSTADVDAGNITATETGVDANNHGGTINVETGDITSGRWGLEVSGYDATEQKYLSEEQFNAMGFGEPEHTSTYNNGGDWTSTTDSFRADDGIWYYRETYESTIERDDGTKETYGGTNYWKQVPVTTSEGTTTVETGSVTVNNTGDEYSRGVYVGSQDDGFDLQATVNGNVTVTSTSTKNSTEGVYVNAQEGDAALIVNGNINVTGTQSRTEGAGVYANDGNGELIVNGNINVSGGKDTQGIYASANGDGSINVDAGNVTVQTTTPGYNSAVSAYSNDNDAKLTMDVGNITTNGRGASVQNNGGTVKVTTGAISAATEGIIVNANDQYESESLTAEQFAALGLRNPWVDNWVDDSGIEYTQEAYAIDDKTTYYHNVDSNGNESWHKEIRSEAKGSTTVVTNGDITLNSTQENEYAQGVEVHNWSALSTSQTLGVTVNGDVAVNSKGGAIGVNVDLDNGSAQTVVNGDVSVSSENSSTGATVGTFGSTSASLNVNGDLSANGEWANGATVSAYDEGNARMIVVGDVAATGAESATGLSVYANDAYAFGSVNGDITANGGDSAVALRLNASSEGDMDVIAKDLSAKAKDHATGLMATTYDDSSVNTMIFGDITAEATGEENSNSWGIETYNYGGNIVVEVAGDVQAEDVGVLMRDIIRTMRVTYTGSYVPTYEDEVVYTSTDGDGNVYKEYRHIDEDGKEIRYDSNGNMWTLVQSEPEEGATGVRVVGDVTADTGANIAMENDKATMTLIVDGTLSGESSAILVSEETIADNLTLTVWEVKPDKDGNLVERQGEWDPDAQEMKREADEELTKKIQYIIRVEQPVAGSISTEGTYAFDNYDVAHEGDTVVLKVNIPDNYRLIDAFNGTDTKVQLLKDANGNYYLVVPRGGAVYLSVTLEEIVDSTSQQTEEKKEEAPASAPVYVTPVVKTEKMDDAAITAAVKEALSKNDIAENSTIEVKTDASGSKTIIIAPETIDETSEEETVLKLTVSADMLTELKDSDVQEISMVSKSGKATASLDIAEVLKTAGGQQDVKLVVSIEENSKKIDTALKALPEKYKSKDGAIAVTARIEDAAGNITLLGTSTNLKIQLQVEFEEGMKILFIDEDGNITETEAVWVEATADVPAHWDIPYMGEGTYLPVVEEE